MSGSPVDKGDAFDSAELPGDCSSSDHGRLAQHLLEETRSLLEVGGQAGYLRDVRLTHLNVEQQRNDPIAAVTAEALLDALEDFRSFDTRTRISVSLPLYTLAEAFLRDAHQCLHARSPGENAEELGLVVRTRARGEHDDRWHSTLLKHGFFRPNASDPNRYVLGQLGDQTLNDEGKVIAVSDASLLQSLGERTRPWSARARFSAVVFESAWNRAFPEARLHLNGEFGRATRVALRTAFDRGLGITPRPPYLCGGALEFAPIVCVPDSADSFELMTEEGSFAQTARVRMHPDQGPAAVVVAHRLTPRHALGSPGFKIAYRVRRDLTPAQSCSPDTPPENRERSTGRGSEWKPLAAPARRGWDWSIVVDLHAGSLSWSFAGPVSFLGPRQHSSEGSWKLYSEVEIPDFRRAAQDGHVVEFQIHAQDDWVLNDAVFRKQSKCARFEVYRNIRLER